MEKKFRKTYEKMEWFSFVTPVTGLNRLNTGKEDDDDDYLYKSRIPSMRNICTLSSNTCNLFYPPKGETVFVLNTKFVLL
jgi:hypothetical protein